MSSLPVVWLSKDSSIAAATDRSNSVSSDMSIDCSICKESRYMIKVSPLARVLYQLIDLQCDGEQYYSVIEHHEPSFYLVAHPTPFCRSDSTWLN